MLPATVNPNRLRRNSSSSGLGGGSPECRALAIPKVPGSPSIDSGRGSSINLDPFGSVDSGGLSGPSTPREQSFSKEELKRRLDEAMKELDLAVSQLPSTKVGENSIHHPAGMKVKMD